MLPGMSDSIRELTASVRAFRDARDWLQFHSPKEMAVAICAEAGELLQHFVWQSSEQSEVRARERREEIGEELADLGILLLEMTDSMGVDLGSAIRAKLAKNEQRYPAHKARGSNKKYTEL
jgi:dCTP diphosphatase